MARKDFAAMESRRPSGDNAARAALRSRMANPTSLRLDELQPNPLNPRYAEDDPAVHELAATLDRIGQLQPALVVARDQYLAAYPDQRSTLGPEPWVVVVGNRRLAASRVAGRSSLDVRVADDLATPEDVEDRVLIENIQRKDLPPLLEAEHLQRRLNRPGETYRSVGDAIGKSHTYVQQRVDLLAMIPEFQTLFRAGQINIKVGRRLGGLSANEQQARFEAGPPYGVLGEAPGNPVANPPTNGAGEPLGNPVANPCGRANDLEPVRLSVGQWLDSALAELDRVLPADDLGRVGRSLAESQRHILAARQALDGSGRE
ncbi:MAG TPA: ParB/RepB/Spo0J family partition protein [Pseudonocardia sp.]|nr:ParB/RepB/Spo0J family partition protein [Pseudonocardia sp.]